jgi:hypothetical protein
MAIKAQKYFPLCFGLPFAVISALPLNTMLKAGCAAIGLLSGSNHRLAIGLSFVLFTPLCLWLIGIQFKMLSVQSCFLLSNTAVNTDAAR